ncbi:helix-turn-helix domain containing protein [Bacillus sp. 3103sda1]|uniref:helix-turn-helix domain containing protein n=1 Tax=Bacillus sp. 3103sda1 TaxID=2953808 RepID=UPI0020A03D35|nr:helix-turn-helix domain containing protein [Bacillus sp. 3103sda1]MCP1124588.1 helix-turn-helix domain containing protein [Bacillus sp. 3103sda1]
MAVAWQHESMKESRLKIYVALEEANFLWDERDVVLFRKLWNEGMSLPELAKRLRRHQTEVALLILDQADKYQIKSRPLGLGVC